MRVGETHSNEKITSESQLLISATENDEAEKRIPRSVNQGQWRCSTEGESRKLPKLTAELRFVRVVMCVSGE